MATERFALSWPIIYLSSSSTISFGLRLLIVLRPNPDKPEQKIFATKTLRHKGYICYSFFVPWCLSGRMEKVLPQKAQNLQLSA
jgi:hypothetical protein